MKLSIIIPIFNGEFFLEKLLQTIDQFTFRDFECIFIDNNSTDNSIATLKGLLVKRTFEYKILSELKQGAGHARNLGVTQARGEYLAFLDCDDVILPKKFEYDLQIFENYTNVDFVFCRAKRFYEDGRIVKHPINRIIKGFNKAPTLGIIWLSNFFHLQGPGSMLIKKSIVEELGGFHSSQTGEDAFLFIRLGLLYNGYFYDLTEYHYFRHMQSTITKSNNTDNGQLFRYFNLRKNLFSDVHVRKNSFAMFILSYQLQIDLLKIQHTGKRIKSLLHSKKLEHLKPSKLIFNSISLIINRRVSHIKYNPFYLLKSKLFKHQLKKRFENTTY